MIMKGWKPENVAKSITDMPLWSQVAHCPDARSELRENAFILATSLKNPQTRMRWGAPDGGYPDVSYYFNREKNMINLDLVWSLMIGMEHSRAANLHEIGHSQGTIHFPKAVDKAYTDMIDVYKKTKDKIVFGFLFMRYFFINLVIKNSVKAARFSSCDTYTYNDSSSSQSYAFIPI